MKAVRGAEGGVDVVDVDEPPGTGELLEMKSTSVCASDLMYIGSGPARSSVTSSPASARTAPPSRSKRSTGAWSASSA